MTEDEIAKLPTPQSDAMNWYSETLQWYYLARSLEQRLSAAMTILSKHAPAMNKDEYETFTSIKEKS